MRDEVKAKVDEYQEYLLERYGLDKSDPDTSGPLLKAQMDANAGITPDYGSPAPDYRHSPEDLRFAITLTLPTDLKNGECGRPDLPICGGSYEGWDIGRALPFPPECVLGMMEDLELLNKALGLTGETCYKLWAEIYQGINTYFIDRKGELGELRKRHSRKDPGNGVWERVEDRQRREDWAEAAKIAEPVDPEYAEILREYSFICSAADIPSRIRRIAPEGDQAGTLLILAAQAFLSEMRKLNLVLGLRDSRAKTKEDAEGVKRAEKLLNEIRWFITLADDRGNADEHHLFSSGVGAWLKQVLPEGFTDKMKARIEELTKDRKDFYDFYQSWVSPFAPDKQAPKQAMSPGALQAFEATVEILKKGASDKQALGLARKLFGLWIIPYTAGARKKARQRDHKVG